MKNFAVFVGILVLCVFMIKCLIPKENLPVLKGDYLGQNPPGDIPEVFAEGIISHGFHEHNLTISPDGTESDIYFSRFEERRYQTPEKLEYGINSEHYDASPFVSPDESYILFQSIRPDGYGGTNIYISFKKRNGTWSEPINMGKNIHSIGNIIAPMISPDGKYLFFATNGPEDPATYTSQSYTELICLFKSYRNGYGTHYWVDAKFIEKLKPNESK